jgi:hypothetical protein
MEEEREETQMSTKCRVEERRAGRKQEEISA